MTGSDVPSGAEGVVAERIAATSAERTHQSNTPVFKRLTHLNWKRLLVTRQ